jgi:oxygen-independent coproporphyrinogen-3 oxidase
MRIYIHVPFCKSKCPYCAFFSRPWKAVDNHSLEQWEQFICREMRLHAMETGTQTIDSIFFGGGTPSLVPPASIYRVINEAAKLFSFAKTIEISLEANPESVTSENAHGFRSAGVNRVSVGVQSFDESLLRAIGRIHGNRQTHHAVDCFRRAGFNNIGIDLMWGLPSESLGSWLSQLKEAVSLFPEHLSCYALTIEQGTPFSRGRPPLPSDDMLSSMYLECCDFLEHAGYRHYEVSNFARPGYECRHNTGYWQGEDYLGLGPSAVSSFRGKRWTQPPDIAQWMSGILKGDLHPQTEILTGKDVVHEYVMLRLRMADGLPLSRLYLAAGNKPKPSIMDLCQDLVREGMAVICGGSISLTSRGMLVSNAIIERFFEELDADG